MRVTILSMLSTNSLSAFSAATTVSPVGRPSSVRLVRQPLSQPAAAAGASKNALPKDRPGIAPPRGSLLNLSV